MIVVAPCSANTLARWPPGLADNVLTESRRWRRPGALVVAPAMNVRMWEHPATQANVATLRERGAVIVGPEAASSPRASSAWAGWRRRQTIPRAIGGAAATRRAARRPARCW